MARTKQTARKSVGPSGPRRPFGGKTPRFLSQTSEDVVIIKVVSGAAMRKAKFLEAKKMNQIIDLTNPYYFQETDLDIYDLTGEASLFDKL